MESCFPVLVTPSAPVSSANHLHDLLRAHLSSRTYGSSALVATTILLNRYAICWTSSRTAAEDLISQQQIQLGPGNLNVKFSPARAVRTGLFVITSRESTATNNDTVYKTLQIKCTDQEYFVYERNQQIIIQFKNEAALPPHFPGYVINAIEAHALCLLSCSWVGQSLTEVEHQISRGHRDLLQVLQTALFLAGVNVCVTGVILGGFNVLVLICATVDDAAAIKDRDSIQLGQLGKLTPLQIFQSQTESQSPPTQKKRGDATSVVYLFWNADVCSVTSEDDLRELDHRIRDRIKGYHAATASLTKTIFLSQDPSTAHAMTHQQIRELINNDYKIIFNPDTLRAEVTNMIQRHAKDALKPLVVLLTGQVQELLLTLRIEGFKDIVWFHNLASPTAAHDKSIDHLVLESIEWSDFQQPTARSKLQQELLLQKAQKGKGTESSGEVRLDVTKLSVAIHLKNLLAWSTSTPPCTLLYGEHASGGPEDNCRIRVDIDGKNKTQALVISGPKAERRASRLEQLLTALQSHRRVFKMNAWNPQHRDCIVDSKLLLHEMKRTATTALFHTPEGRVIAEVVSLNAKTIHEFHKFLESLSPREDEWSIPPPSSKAMKSKEWHTFLHDYAIAVKVTSSKVTAWGFGGLLDEARRYAESILFSEPSRVDSKLDIVPSRPNENETTVTLSFKHKECGFYYLAFEAELDTYVAQAYHVKASKIEPDLSLSNKKNFPPVKVALTGTPEQVQEAQEYLESFADNLIMKAFFPMVDAIKYKEIFESVEHHKHRVAAIRRMPSAVAADPYVRPGFICIRLTPPIHNKGIRRMTLPADCTVVIQSPVRSDQQREQVEAIYRDISAISSGYLEAALQFPVDSVVGKHMSIRHSREEFSTTHGLVGITWTVANGADHGELHLWAATDAILQSALEALPLLPAAAYEDETPGSPVEEMIRWPDAALPLVMETEELKEEMEGIMQRVASEVNIQVYNDCADDLKLLRLIGSAEDVRDVKMQMHMLFEETLKRLEMIQIRLTSRQLRALTVDDGKAIKNIQSSRCVLIVLSPVETDLTEPCEFYDLCPSPVDSVATPLRSDNSVALISQAETAVVVRIVQSALHELTGSKIVIVSKSDQRANYNEAFSMQEEAGTEDITFLIEVPSNLPSQQATMAWLARSIHKALMSAESSELASVSIVTSMGEAEGAHIYSVLAQSIADFVAGTHVSNLKQIDLSIQSSSVREETKYSDLHDDVAGDEDALQQAALDILRQKQGRDRTASSASSSPPGFPTLVKVTTPGEHIADDSLVIIVKGLHGAVELALTDIRALVGA